MRTKTTTALVIALAFAATGRAQTPGAQTPGAQTQGAQTPGSQTGAAPASGSTLEQAAADAQRRLEDSLAELDALRRELAEEKIPLHDRLAGLEAELDRVRSEHQQATRLRDTRTLDLSNLRNRIKEREEEATYLSNLLSEYVRNFESRLHIAELQRYENVLEAARLAPDNATLSPAGIYAAQTDLLSASIVRLEEALGGVRFEGTGLDEDGRVRPGTYVLVGPAALFRSADGKDVGTAEQRLGSLEPSAIPFGNPDDATAAAQVITFGEGLFPFDPTLGNAHKIEATEETLAEHVRKGGPVMVPIFALAGAALLVALYKWIGLLFVRNPSRTRVNALLHAVARRDERMAMEKAEAVGGPTGRMLAAGVEHIEEPRALIEEIMYETVLTTRLRLQRLLPFIAISAAAAPLLGLLGTVTGIINTFKLITVFGSGDVKTLSGGISEALITTEFGLIVAIPSLLLHALLSRKARGVIDQMERAAIAFMNQVSKAYPEARPVPVAAGTPVTPALPAASEGTATVAATASSTREQVREALKDLLAPVVRPSVRPPASPGESEAAERERAVIET